MLSLIGVLREHWDPQVSEDFEDIGPEICIKGVVLPK